MAVKYEFSCRECGDSVEQATNKPGVHCGKEMKRVWGLAGISFKGSGFYSKDYK